MKRIIIDEPWLKEILPRGWPTGTSTVVTGAGRSGRPLIGQIVAAHWLRQGGSVVFMPLQTPSYELVAEALRRVPGVDVADHDGRVAFIELDAELPGMVVEAPGRIRANLALPQVWDQALEAALGSVPGEGPGVLLVASALNLLLFSPTHADALLQRMKGILSSPGDRTILFAVSDSARGRKVAELEEVADNLLISHSTRNPPRLFVRVARMKGVKSRPDPVEVPVAPEALAEVKAAADRNRRRVMPVIADL